MKSIKYLMAGLLALLLLASTTGPALAAGPVDDTPPTEIDIKGNLATVLQNYRGQKEGPAPCLTPYQIGSAVEIVQLQGNLK